MKESEIKKYQRLNELAEQNGIVIFGGNTDKELPLCELRQSYNIEQKMYNRSISGLSVKDAISAYDACVSTLDPETVLLHIGMADLDLFSANSAVEACALCAAPNASFTYISANPANFLLNSASLSVSSL